MKREDINRIISLHLTGLTEAFNSELCKLNTMQLQHLAEVTDNVHPEISLVAKYYLLD